MGTRTDAVRCIVIFINTAFLAAGLTSLAMGIWLYITNYELWKFSMVVQYVDSESLRQLWLADVIFMAGGAAVVVFGLVGMCGVCARNSCLWGFHAFCLTLAIGAHIAALVYVIISYDQHQGTEKHLLGQLRRSFDGVGRNDFTREFIEIQMKYECCGVTGLTDYSEFGEFDIWSTDRGTMRDIPPRSCLARDENPYLQGCHSALNSIMFNHFVAIVVLSSVSIFCALLLFVLALCLCVRYKDKAIVTHL